MQFTINLEDKRNLCDTSEVIHGKTVEQKDLGLNYDSAELVGKENQKVLSLLGSHSSHL
jgi:hypothetical protein